MKPTLKLTKDDFPLNFHNGVFITKSWWLKAEYVNLRPAKFNTLTEAGKNFEVSSISTAPIFNGLSLMPSDDRLQDVFYAEVSTYENVDLTPCLYRHLDSDQSWTLRRAIFKGYETMWFLDKFTEILKFYDRKSNGLRNPLYLTLDCKIAGIIMPSLLPEIEKGSWPDFDSGEE